jgi:hypothetical protein
MADSKVVKSPVVIPITTTTIIEDFDSVSLIDAGATDGFRLEDSQGHIGVIPTGIVVNIGGTQGKVGSKIIVLAPLSGSLNVTAIVYY